jgi:hypothetical protein
MEPVKRAVRVPADNCPDCMSDHTLFLMASFNDATPGDGGRSTMQVSYRCWICGRSWTTSWEMEHTA